MKTYTYLKAFISICFILGITSSAAAGDVSGTWVADVDGSRIEMAFMIDGTTLTGTVDNSESGSAEIKEGIVDGSKISFHVLRTLSGFGDSEFKIVWTGEVIGDEVLFKREFAGTSRGLIARRKPATSDDQARQKDTQNDAGSYDHLSGTWTGKVPLGEIYLEIQVKGSSVSGTVNLGGRSMGEIKDGKIEGNKISFHTIRQTGFDIFDVPFEGIIRGEKIHFIFISVNNGRPVRFIAIKKKSGPEIQEEQMAQEAEGPYRHIAGKWTASYTNGVMSMNFKVSGNRLTGTAGPVEFTQNNIQNGKIENNKITFHVFTQLLGRQVKGLWEGTIVGDKIHFTVQLQTNIFNFIARKIEIDEKGVEKEEVQLPPTVDPSGTWVMEAGGQKFTMVFKAVGMSLTGYIRISPSNSTIMIPPDAKISGETISFSMMKRVRNSQRAFRIPWVGKVAGDEIHFEGGPFNQFESVTAKKIKGSDGSILDKEQIKLARDEEIKNSKVNKKYKELREKDSEYNSAMEYFDEYRYHLALPLLEQVVERLSSDAVALHHLGVCLIMESVYPSGSHERKDMRARAILKKAKKKGMESEMLEYYLKVIPEDGGLDDSFSKQKDAEAILNEAEKAYGMKDFQKCLGLYAKAMEMDPTYYKAVLYVGDSYFGNSQYKDAIEWFERATKVDPDKETAWRFWGDCLMHMDKKDEGRSKFIDALIAEPYNQLSWNGIRNLANMNKIKHEPPDIKRPQRLDATGGLQAAEKNNDSSDQKKTPPDGTESWSYYNEVAKVWRATKFKEKFPDEDEYRHTLDEEKEALELVAEKVSENIKKDRIKSNDLNPGM